MGTYFSIQANCSSPAPLQAAARAIGQVNERMTTYDDTSALMQLNAAPVGEFVNVGPALVDVLALSARVHEETSGAFDVTVGSLVELWGFGRETDLPAPPVGELEAWLTADAQPETRPPSEARRVSARTLNLSAIAKGYAVDQAADVLDGAECSHYMVDIGGEVRTRGMSPRNRSWRIGIESPTVDSTGVHTVLQLQDMAIATSGDYRNFRMLDGRRISHTLDPRTARPIEHHLASVTVLTERCALADAYATALTVLGPDEGWRWAAQRQLAAYFIIRVGESYEVRYTDAMRPFLMNPSENSASAE